MIRNKIFYSIGDTFWVKIDGMRTVGLCCVQAMDGMGCAIGYFYKVSEEEEVTPAVLRSPDAIMRFGDLDIVEGRWPKASIVNDGNLPQGDFFIFTRKNMFGQRWVTKYDQSAKLVSEVKLDVGEGMGLPDDDLLGAGLVATLLDHIQK